MRIATLLLALLLAVPSQAAAQNGEKLTHALLGVSFVLHGIDIAQSMYAFGKAPDTFKEANPLLRCRTTRPDSARRRWDSRLG